MIEQIRFDDHGLVPVVAQDAETQEVLMLAYANKEALELTLKTGEAHYYSRNRNEIWHKGEVSGHIQRIAEIRYDCDADAILYIVYQKGVACHTGNHSCFYRGAPQNTLPLHGLALLQKVVADRKLNPTEGSYTKYLFDKGIDKILKKVGEESAEVIIAAKNNEPEEIIYETADLLYHLTVMLSELNVEWEAVMEELEGRQGKSKDR